MSPTCTYLCYIFSFRGLLWLNWRFLFAGVDSNSNMDAQTIKNRCVLLQKYLDHSDILELQALYALQALVTKLDHPAGKLSIESYCWVFKFPCWSQISRVNLGQMQKFPTCYRDRLCWMLNPTQSAFLFCIWCCSPVAIICLLSDVFHFWLMWQKPNICVLVFAHVLYIFAYRSHSHISRTESCLNIRGSDCCPLTSIIIVSHPLF